MECPVCGADDIVEAPAWAPLGAGWNIFEGNEWEYECQECRHTFKMPIPGSPAGGRKSAAVPGVSRRAPAPDNQRQSPAAALRVIGYPGDRASPGKK